MSFRPDMKAEDWDTVYGESVRIINEQIIAAFRPQQIKAAGTRGGGEAGQNSRDHSEGSSGVNRLGRANLGETCWRERRWWDANPAIRRFLSFLEISRRDMGFFQRRPEPPRWTSQRSGYAGVLRWRGAAGSPTRSSGACCWPRSSSFTLYAGILSTRCPSRARYFSSFAHEMFPRSSALLSPSGSPVQRCTAPPL